MKIDSYLFTAYRFISHRQNSTLKVAVITIAISLLPLLVSLNVIKSMQNQLLNQSLNTFSYHVQLRYLLPASKDSYLEIKESLLKENSIYKIALEMRSGAMIFSKAGRSGVTLRSIEDDTLLNDISMAKGLGISPLSIKSQEVIIGQGLASKHNLKIGDEMRLLTIKNSKENFNPQISRFKVVDIFKTGISESDSNWVFITQNDLEQLLSPKQIDMFLGIKVSEPYNESFTSRFDSIVNKLENSENWISTYWQTSNQFFIENMKTSKILLIIVLSLIVMVSCININGALQIFYIQNQSAMAMLDVMGLKGSSRFAILFTTSLLIGVLGLIFGVILAIFMSINIGVVIDFIGFLNQLFYSESVFDFYISDFRTSIDLTAYFIVAICVLLIIAISSIISLKTLQKVPLIQILNRTL